MLRAARRVESVVSSKASRSLLSVRWSSCASKILRQHDPLKVLFCGADEFSIYSLRALHELHNRQPNVVESIDVVCRPDKRVGRGLKKVQEVPIKSVASTLGLRLHQIDTFKNWSLSPYINLIVAVSFGLLVPARILNSAKYGGLNVHPSLLPDLRGPAPMIHTLLKRRGHTGVTLQTMHPTQFDHGDILAQTPLPGVPVSHHSTTDDLLRMLGPLGAEMLCRGIESGIFVPPTDNIRQGVSEPTLIEHAHKVTPEDRRIDWRSWTADEIELRDRVLGRLWDMETYSRCFPDKSAKRTTFHGPWNVHSAAVDQSIAIGQPFLTHDESNVNSALGFKTIDGRFISPSAATLDGEPKAKGLRTLRSGLAVKNGIAID